MIATIKKPCKQTVRITYKPVREVGRGELAVRKLQNDRVVQDVNRAVNRWLYSQ